MKLWHLFLLIVIPRGIILHFDKNNMLFSAAISSFALDLRSQWSPGAVCSCLRHLRPFYCISLKKYMRGEYDRGLSVVVWHLFCFSVSHMSKTHILSYITLPFCAYFEIYAISYNTRKKGRGHKRYSVCFENTRNFAFILQTVGENIIATIKMWNDFCYPLLPI